MTKFFSHFSKKSVTSWRTSRAWHPESMGDGDVLCVPFVPSQSCDICALMKYHTAAHQYVCSGTKQTKLILSLYDHAASSQNMARNMLQESATLLRETIQPALSSSINSIDKQIRLVFSATGPLYVMLECIGETLHVRRVRNLYYTHSFADLIMREMVMGHAQATCLA